MKHYIVISTAINFKTETDVSAYLLITPRALPDGDCALSCDEYKIGWEHIVLLDTAGRLMLKMKRRDVRGMAVDGKPVAVHGDGFAPIDSTQAVDASPEEEAEQDEE